MSPTFVIVAVAVYVLGLLFLGAVASTRIRNATDFVVAGRRLGLGLCTFTLFATWFGGGTLIGAAGASYAGGLNAVVADPFGAALCLLLAGAFYVRLLRRMRLLTVPDFFRRRFGKPAEILSALSILPAYIGWVGSQLLAVGTVLSAMAGLPFVASILIAAAIVLVYTVLGGMWGVTLTDFFQALVLIAAICLLLPIVLGEAGGISAVLDRLPEGRTRFLPTGGLLEWLFFVQAWLLIGLGNLPGQDLMQRALSSKNERVAQWGAYLGGSLYLVVGLIPVALGMIGSVLMPGLQNPEEIVPRLAMEYLPPAGLALFLGALFSALMSSADSGLLAPASVFGQNIMRNLAPDLKPKEVLVAVRVGVVIFCGLALAVALWFQSVYSLMVESWTVMMVGLFGPLTLGMYWKRTNGPGAVAGIVAGLAVWLGLVGTELAWGALSSSVWTEPPERTDRHPRFSAGDRGSVPADREEPSPAGPDRRLRASDRGKGSSRDLGPPASPSQVEPWWPFPRAPAGGSYPPRPNTPKRWPSSSGSSFPRWIQRSVSGPTTTGGMSRSFRRANSLPSPVRTPRSPRRPLCG